MTNRSPTGILPGLSYDGIDGKENKVKASVHTLDLVTGKLAALSLSAGTVPGSTIKQQPKPHSVSDLQDARKTGFTSEDRSLFINLK